MTTRIEQARAKLAQAQARVQKLEAIARGKEKQSTARRRLILGEAIENAISAGKFSQEQMFSILDDLVTRKHDRVFMGLSVEGYESEEEISIDVSDQNSGMPSQLMEQNQERDGKTQPDPTSSSSKVNKITGRPTYNFDDDDLAAQFNTVGI